MLELSEVGNSSQWTAETRMGRNHERTPVVIEIILDSSAGRRASRISDLSLGGCYVESITQYREGEPIAFELTSSDGQGLRFTGEVAYILDGFGFGLKFTNINDDQLEFLKRVLPEA
ncbi:MAG: PilZ domain-containing protein [Blastocatellia bacterium]|nr:PilZ domain-containing protein [Blastocatellia bacterium]HBE83723.1 hypothetical protein [Blastocatellia bacterium]